MVDIHKKTRNSLGNVRTNGERQGMISDADLERSKQTQAQRVIHKFGGARALCRALNEVCGEDKRYYNPSSIYRWTYPRDKGGTGGTIPTRAMVYIFKAARLYGLLLTEEDFFPDRL